MSSGHQGGRRKSWIEEAVDDVVDFVHDMTHPDEVAKAEAEKDKAKAAQRAYHSEHLANHHKTTAADVQV